MVFQVQIHIHIHVKFFTLTLGKKMTPHRATLRSQDKLMLCYVLAVVPSAVSWNDEALPNCTRNLC